MAPEPAPRRIVCDPAVLGGKPVVEGTRMSVEQILGLIANGMSVEAIVSSYPVLSAADVRGAVDYARRSLHNEVIVEVGD